ncbi:MAG TPA: hypothetical protein VFA56_12700 [Gaiellaceae bacterium]|nr:hypothetical protein [Gaiellaceae bacterium]
MGSLTVRTQDRDSLASFLGWFSIALGAAQIAMPRALCRLVGSTGKGSAPAIMRAMGLRELAQGIGILTRPRPTMWLWSRVAGDGLDLAALGLVAARNRRARTAFAIANVAAVTVPDVKESLHLMQKQGEPRSGKELRKAITINRGREEVERSFEADTGLRGTIAEHGATVRFEAAPGGRGTEVVVEWTQDPPLGELGALVQKLSGNDLATALSDDLRRLKQRIEVGEVVRSDGAPEGHRLSSHLKQRPAQPVEEAVR